MLEGLAAAARGQQPSQGKTDGMPGCFRGSWDPSCSQQSGEGQGGHRSSADSHAGLAALHPAGLLALEEVSLRRVCVTQPAPHHTSTPGGICSCRQGGVGSGCFSVLRHKRGSGSVF